ncbi:hypothetical protein ACIQ4I_00285 [Rummeliibacillus sp. NPDC094406]|uniref:hypothetical protein n=1 Tax=Rummeliibacillus sp. NPDC094406 TaxID=3364511 RepID=UPI003829F6C4
MKNKIVIPILAASLLATGCSAHSDVTNETKASQQSMSKAEKEKIDQQIQKAIDNINAIYKKKSYVENGDFSPKDYGLVKKTLNISAEALNIEKIDVNDDKTIKSISDKIVKRIDHLNLTEKKKFLADLKKPATIYNAIYRESIYDSLYDFDRENNIENSMDDFINYATMDNVSTKDVVEKANLDYDLPKYRASYWKEEEKLFKDKYGESFSQENYKVMLSIMKNFQDMQEVQMLFLNNFRLGTQEMVNPKDALKKIDSLSAKQLKLIKTINDNLNVPERLSYDEYSLNHD